MRKVSLFYDVIKNKQIMKVVHQAPHLEKLHHLDVEDRKAIKSYNATRKRKIRSLKKIKIEPKN